MCRAARWDDAMTTIHANDALLNDGWQARVRVSIVQGAIAAIEKGVDPQPADERCAALLPGMPNLHSHAFQRGMAGLAEVRGTAADSFWSWRETMYRFALTMTPDQVEAVAAQLYVEMLEAGFTRVGEFHYLHHDRDGSPFGDIAEMAARICAASAEAGIGLTLLPVFYAHGGFGGVAPSADQRRFITDLDQFQRLLAATRQHVARLDAGIAGIAPHSLRAVTPEQLAQLQSIAPAGPLHIHVAEQIKEVDDCIAWSKQRPVAWLLDHAPVDRRWCLIHATHMTEDETRRMAKSGAVAGLCPVTEANLGDGIFNARVYLDAGGMFGIGSDSNVLIGIGDELHQLEYSQRLRDRARNVLAAAGGSTGRALLEGALTGGAQALGQSLSGLERGAPADMISLDTAHAAFAGRRRDSLLDAWIFASHRAIDGVWVSGRKLVSGGRHSAREAIGRRFRGVMQELTAA
jgi:formimidoylglutamate deiminase